MNTAEGLSLQELLASLQRRHAGLPCEIGTFIVFEVSEALLAHGPLRISADSVRIGAEGRVTLSPGGESSDEVGAARGVHALLTQVLLIARPAPTPALLRIVEHGPGQSPGALRALRDQLEAALVPLNRLACGRVLARLLREAAADRSRRAPGGSEVPAYRDLDAALSDLLGGGEAAGGRGDEPTIREHVERVDELPGAVFDPTPDAAEEAPTALRFVGDRLSSTSDLDAANASPEPGPAPVPTREVSTERIAQDARPELPSTGLTEIPPPRAGVWIGIAFVALAALLGLGVSYLRPDVVARLRGQELEAAPMDLPVPSPVAPVAADLVLEVAPARSQVLMLVGHAPVEVRGVAVGVAHEFVALSEGHRPSRALIAPDDPWEPSAEGPFYELAMQTLPLGKSAEPALGASLLPRNMGTATRHDGRVRVITTPRGAKVYRVVGFAPEVRIRDVSTEAELRILVDRDGYVPQELRIREADWPLSSAHPELRERVTLKRAR